MPGVTSTGLPFTSKAFTKVVLVVVVVTTEDVVRVPFGERFGEILMGFIGIGDVIDGIAGTVTLTGTNVPLGSI
ncbi:hypothetical protein B5X24_HaOG212159 [Helicoverpa armigera]|nr:hypothetical protein B5X24_HaOG212159 [Helicoverpa armigera]